MEQLKGMDIVAMPSSLLTYIKTTFINGGTYKWIPAALIALLTDLGSMFNELFYIIIILWLCDLIIGTARAFHDPETTIEWARMFRSVLKLVVIGVGVVAVHSIEHLIQQGTGIDPDGKLCAATLLVIGTAEAFSIVDNLVYFFPGLTKVATSIKNLLGKGRNGNGSH